ARRLRRAPRRGLLRPASQPRHRHAGAKGVARAADRRLRRGAAGAAAGRRDDALEARLAHPIFDAVRPWLGIEGSLAALNAAAEAAGLATESGRPVRFVAPGAKRAGYEVQVHQTGRVETRP